MHGASIAILKSDKQIHSVDGAGTVSKSEDLLSILDGLLRGNNISKREIGQIVISDKPGSLTGLRIGAAIAKGLGGALLVPVNKISILDAMADNSESVGVVFSMLLTQKNVYYKKFIFANRELQHTGEIENEPESTIPEMFTHVLESDRNNFITAVVFEEQESFFSEYLGQTSPENKIRIFPLKGNPAEILGIASILKRVR